MPDPVELARDTAPYAALLGVVGVVTDRIVQAVRAKSAGTKEKKGHTEPLSYCVNQFEGVKADTKEVKDEVFTVKVDIGLLKDTTGRIDERLKASGLADDKRDERLKSIDSGMMDFAKVLGRIEGKINGGLR